MTSTSSTTLRRRRLVAAALAIPLSLGMTSAAFATGPADGTAGALRTAGAPDHAAQNAAAVSAAARVAADKAAAEKAAAEQAAADKAAAEKAAADKAAAKDDKPATGSAAGAVSGKSAATATTTNTSYVNGNTNSSKADRPNAPVTKSAAPSQPLSNADKTGKGANVGTAEKCATTNPYCSNGTGVEPGNGNDSAPAKGQPCAGCVGKADNKNPKGQAPGGSDRNAGYECDRNQGIGQMNPAHTGCTSPAPQPTATKTPPATKSPSPTPTPTKPGKGTASITVTADCRTVSVVSSKDISHVVVFFKDGTSQKFDGLSGKTWTRTFTQDVASARAKSATSTATGTATGCGVLPTGTPTPTATACPSGSSMPGNGNGNGKACKDDDDDDDRKVSICHATGSATNPYVLIEISEKALKAHREHQDGRDIIPAPARGCPGGTSENKITICHATGSATNPYVIVTVNRNGLEGHGGHAGDIIPAPANGVCPGGTTTFDQCPNMAGLQPAGTSCTQPPLTTTLFCPDGSVMPAGNPVNCPVPPRDVCPNQDGVQLMGPCNNGNGNGGGGGGGSPISGVKDQPATGPVTGPPTTVPPVIVPNGNRPPTLIGTVTSPATRPAATRPRALPFTGTEMVLLAQLGAFLLLAGGGALLLARRERTARAR